MMASIKEVYQPVEHLDLDKPDPKTKKGRLAILEEFKRVTKYFEVTKWHQQKNQMS